MERRRRPSERRPSKRRLAGLLACAAVPVLLAAACSSGSSGSDGGKSGGKDGAESTSATPSATATTPTLAPARFTTLPSSCATITKSTVGDLVPKAKHTGGTATKTTDTAARSGCSWTGNGKDGFQYRWLAVTLERYDSSVQLGAAEDQAHKRFTDEVAALKEVSGTSVTAVSGLGDEADSVAGKATVSKVTSQNDTVVVRTGNVVLIVEYNGAGLEGKKNPSAKTVEDDAKRAAKDVVASVAAANA
jgi:hypothetical protein